MVYIFPIKFMIWLNAQPIQLYICARLQNVIRHNPIKLLGGIQILLCLALFPSRWLLSVFACINHAILELT